MTSCHCISKNAAFVLSDACRYGFRPPEVGNARRAQLSMRGIIYLALRMFSVVPTAAVGGSRSFGMQDVNCL